MEGTPIGRLPGQYTPGQRRAVGLLPSPTSQRWDRASQDGGMTPQGQHSGGGGHVESAMGRGGEGQAGRFAGLWVGLPSQGAHPSWPGAEATPPQLLSVRKCLRSAGLSTFSLGCITTT